MTVSIVFAPKHIFLRFEYGDMGEEPNRLSDVDPFPDADDTADPDAVATEAWKAETTAFERVEAILRRTQEWQSASDIADRALVSTPTARKHLTALAESGHAAETDVGGATCYRRNPDQRRFERIQQLADEHSRTELEGAIRRMKGRKREFEDTYDVSSPEELVEVLEPDDEDGWENLSRWKTTRRNLAFAKTALSFKETRDIDAMSSGDHVLEENA